MTSGSAICPESSAKRVSICSTSCWITQPRLAPGPAPEEPAERVGDALDEQRLVWPGDLAEADVQRRRRSLVGHVSPSLAVVAMLIVKICATSPTNPIRCTRTSHLTRSSVLGHR